MAVLGLALALASLAFVHLVTAAPPPENRCQAGKTQAVALLEGKGRIYPDWICAGPPLPEVITPGQTLTCCRKADALEQCVFGLNTTSSIDVEQTNAALKGFSAGFTDGTYGYLGHTAEGHVVQFSLSDFTSGSTVRSVDLKAIDATFDGYRGGVSDGTYAYFIPSRASSTFNGNLVRISVSDFTTSGVTSLDLAAGDAGRRGFAGGFIAGGYIYLAPADAGAGPSGLVVRVSLSNFAAGGISSLDLTAVHAALKGFWGAFTDGTYGYLAPSHNGARHGNLVRFSLSDFTTNGVSFMDFGTVDATLKGFVGGFTDGTYGYLVPNGNDVLNGHLVRFSLSDFTTGGVSFLDLTGVDANLKGFYGGFTDNTYGYLVPYNNDARQGKLVRFALDVFTSNGVTVLDVAAEDSNLKGFSGGFTDGTYGYLVPLDNGAGWHGNVVRTCVVPHTPLHPGTTSSSP